MGAFNGLFGCAGLPLRAILRLISWGRDTFRYEVSGENAERTRWHGEAFDLGRLVGREAERLCGMAGIGRRCGRSRVGAVGIGKMEPGGQGRLLAWSMALEVVCGSFLWSLAWMWVCVRVPFR